MKTGVKIALGAVAIIALTGVFGYNKAMQLTDTFGKMTMKVVGVSKVKIKGGTWQNLFKDAVLTFNISLYFHNPTADDFTVSGFGVASLKKVGIFIKNKFVGESVVNISEISIPSNNELIIHDLPVSVSVGNVMDVVPDIISLVNSNNNDFLNSMKVSATLDVAGTEFEITT